MDKANKGTLLKRVIALSTALFFSFGIINGVRAQHEEGSTILNEVNDDLKSFNEYEIGTESIMIFDMDDNLLAFESLDELDQSGSRKLVKLLNQSDFLFNLDGVAYYIKTQ